MGRRDVHCQAITRLPEIAQTGTAVKLGAIVEIMDAILLAQRQSPWKVFFPPGYEADTTDGTGTTTEPVV